MTNAVQNLTEQLTRSTDQVVFGAHALARYLVMALLARGHVLIEGPPGLGKTLLARCLAQQLGGDCRRVQCTPDLLPSDLTGLNVYRSSSERFEFVPGPLFADVVLVDELNRTGPKTQAALLEAMEERQVSIDRETRALPPDFVVIATQNPHEFEGTYPLPEAQLDRFLLRLRITHPEPEIEMAVLRAYDTALDTRSARVGDLTAVDRRLIEQARRDIDAIRVSDAVYAYVAAIAAASRRHPQLSLGLSTRGTLSIMRCARIEAAMQGMDFVTPDHVKQVAHAVMGHRMVAAPEATLEGVSAEQLVDQVLAKVPVPREAQPTLLMAAGT